MRKTPKHEAQNLLVLYFMRPLGGGYKRITKLIKTGLGNGNLQTLG
jgi:hypothetical protein